MSTLPALLSWEDVQVRLREIFPDGIVSDRHRLVSDVATSTIFMALYINAVEGTGIWLAPKHVYRMSDVQAALISDDERSGYAVSVMKPGGRAPGTQWYQDTTRESIRDDTLREAFVVVGAVTELATVPTTSGKGRYALQPAFAALFDPKIVANDLDAAIAAWRTKHLTKGALARIAIVKAGAGGGGDHVALTFPNGETRRMKKGPSSEITKSVIEVFAPRFMVDPAVLFVSESGNKVVARDDALAKSIGLQIKADKDLPDIVLADLAPEHPLIVFVEVVATDGPINERRKAALESVASGAGFPLEHVAFVTAYLDRGRPAFKKTVGTLAWGSFAWFAGEPEHLVRLEANGSLQR
ncbi:restriction endonuclease [Mesorhizobium sp. M1A.T.Ca.IN.004.03.1.1]|uniref:BsuBI/PstI family type II restriction endonuclease n=1 Tax=Mesorhizobium sp. M1A.T.Ca.IN.004.03.1.1 TaxID=2496795 RepID=UPI000FCC9C88|nr:BsuBI/PstI family type II restriction endonuclease [Mesorhizobium sp. M1A.T.Ca.IN.004.03.1.1]RUV41189.1 restriction endonuclease [Mesorhizobium sp. M1A.T.Ca.IN.004.03.1.1]